MCSALETRRTFLQKLAATTMLVCVPALNNKTPLDVVFERKLAEIEQRRIEKFMQDLWS